MKYLQLCTGIKKSDQSGVSTLVDLTPACTVLPPLSILLLELEPQYLLYLLLVTPGNASFVGSGNCRYCLVTVIVTAGAVPAGDTRHGGVQRTSPVTYRHNTRSGGVR